jgi:hypothetical protein
MILNLRKNFQILKNLNLLKFANLNVGFTKLQLFQKSFKNPRLDGEDNYYQEYMDMYDTNYEPQKQNEHSIESHISYPTRNVNSRHGINKGHIRTTSEISREGDDYPQEDNHGEGGDSQEIHTQKREYTVLKKLEQFVHTFYKHKYDDLFSEILNVKKDYITKDIIREYETFVKGDKETIYKIIQTNIACPTMKHFKAYIKRRPHNPKFRKQDYEYYMRLKPLLHKYNIDERGFFTSFIFVNTFINYFDSKLESHIQKIEVSKDVLTFTKPEQWYPGARAMKRKIYYHMGPTNSGKTSYAIKRLTEAKTGLYCAPLRLLAAEVRQKLVDNGVQCSLLTGQEKIFVTNQTHLSMTVEKTDLNKFWEVAVIDEIQMIEDDQRGSAWTTALLGLKADEIHICGDERAFKLIHEITKNTGDELYYKKYKRFSTLHVENEKFTFEKLKQGDCIIGFSKDNLIKYKSMINYRYRNLNCALIYGDLPPETKKDQAKKFNIADETSYNFLCASDAIGMGLNLKINRIIFSNVYKIFRGDRVKIVPQLVRQIAGRAGRSNSDGFVTAFYDDDLEYIRECLKQATLYNDEDVNLEPLAVTGEHTFKQNETAIKQACLFPPVATLLSIAELMNEKLKRSEENKVSLVEILQLFEIFSSSDTLYFIKDLKKVLKVARVLEEIKAPIQLHYNFVMAPCKTKEFNMSYLKRYFSDYVTKGVVNIPNDLYVDKSKYFGRTVGPEELKHLQDIHNCIEMYTWLAQKFRNEFIGFQDALMYKGKVTETINYILGAGRRSRSISISNSNKVEDNNDDN